MEYYEKNHQNYFESTVNTDPSAFLEPLVKFLEPQVTILDVGCGSGRDLRWFDERGFRPTGFEKSPSLVQLARQHSDCPVIEGDFRVDGLSKFSFSALVSVGSLVHLPRDEFPVILKKLCQTLSAGGHILITLKEGSSTLSSADGRRFTLWAPADLEAIFADLGLYILDFSRQVSKIRSDDIWIGYVLKMGNGSS